MPAPRESGQPAGPNLGAIQSLEDQSHKNDEEGSKRAVIENIFRMSTITGLNGYETTAKAMGDFLGTIEAAQQAASSVYIVKAFPAVGGLDAGNDAFEKMGEYFGGGPEQETPDIQDSEQFAGAVNNLAEHGADMGVPEDMSSARLGNVSPQSQGAFQEQAIEH